MKDTPNVRESLDRALMDMKNAQNLITASLKSDDAENHRDALQNTYNRISDALAVIRDADYKSKK